AFAPTRVTIVESVLSIVPAAARAAPVQKEVN
ncbi:MAG: hypothetical protein JWO15_3796, partial [Sphingomonadales bacterium]|nr:hypothetical protein [Sphingomonadales bacterium]